MNNGAAQMSALPEELSRLLSEVPGFRTAYEKAALLKSACYAAEQEDRINELTRHKGPIESEGYWTPCESYSL
jgi:hypothetical protein